MVTKDMAITLPEFLRLLPLLAGNCAHEMRDDGIAIGTPGRGVVISAQAASPRVLASLVLQRCRVRIAFAGLERREAADFLARFERLYQKGGG